MVTVTAKLKNPVDGAFALFTPSTLTRDDSDGSHTLPLPTRSVFEDDGTLTVDLPATDDPDITPAGWFYRIEIRAGDYRDAFSAFLPASVDPVDLFDLAPAVTQWRATRYGLVLSVNGVRPDSEGNVVVSGGGESGPVAWTDITGKPTTFAPSAHTHTQTEVTGLTTALAGKEASGTAAAAVSAHTAASDPHPQYLTAAEGNAAYDATGAATSAVSTHVAASDPHPQYLTASEGNSAYEVAGAVAAHTAATDPHPQYLTATEGNAAYDAAGAASTAVAALPTVAHSGAYADLTGKPALATVATSGAYSDLTGKPALSTVATSGSYADLSSKPTIPAVTTFAQFAVWSGSAWPTRPGIAQPVIWIGGTTSPSGASANDVWIPAS